MDYKLRIKKGIYRWSSVDFQAFRDMFVDVRCEAEFINRVWMPILYFMRAEDMVVFKLRFGEYVYD